MIGTPILSCPQCAELTAYKLRDDNPWAHRQRGHFRLQCPFCDHIFRLGFSYPSDEDHTYYDPEVEHDRFATRAIEQEFVHHTVEVDNPDPDSIDSTANAPQSILRSRPSVRRTTRSNTGSDPNDMRSDSMNPNNNANRSSTGNRANQMNPNNRAYKASRGRKN